MNARCLARLVFDSAMNSCSHSLPKLRKQHILHAVPTILLTAGYLAIGMALSAQTIEIRLLNGLNGRVITDHYVNVWVGSERKDAMAIPLNKDGVAKLRVTYRDEEVDIQGHGKDCGVPCVINPVVKYGDHLRINVGLVLCQFRKADYSWLAISDFPTKDVLQHGIVTENSCGKATALPKPGELTIFVRPLSWWEKMKE